MKTFEDWYKLAKQYHDKYGNLDVPYNYIAEDNSHLGAWITKIRGIYSGISSYSGTLSPSQIEQLESLGMMWNSGEQIPDYSIENCRTEEDYRKHRELYLEGIFEERCLYDAVIDDYEEGLTIYAIAKKYGEKTKMVRKILITAGLFSSKKQEQALELYNHGFNLEQIAERMKISTVTADSYLPLYTKWGRSLSHREKAKERNVELVSEVISRELIEEIGDEYLRGASVKELCSNYRFSKRKVTKMLVSAGVYSTDRSREINRLYEAGRSQQEIADLLNVSLQAVNTYLPYEGAIYNTEESSKEAKYQKEYRKRQAAKEKLLKSTKGKTYFDKVWRNIRLFEGSQIKLEGYNEYYRVVEGKVCFRDGTEIGKEELRKIIEEDLDTSPIILGLLEMVGARRKR